MHSTGGECTVQGLRFGLMRANAHPSVILDGTKPHTLTVRPLNRSQSACTIEGHGRGQPLEDLKEL